MFKSFFQKRDSEGARWCDEQAHRATPLLLRHSLNLAVAVVVLSLTACSTTNRETRQIVPLATGPSQNMARIVVRMSSSMQPGVWLFDHGSLSESLTNGLYMLPAAGGSAEPYQKRCILNGNGDPIQLPCSTISELNQRMSKWTVEEVSRQSSQSTVTYEPFRGYVTRYSSGSVVYNITVPPGDEGLRLALSTGVVLLSNDTVPHYQIALTRVQIASGRISLNPNFQGCNIIEGVLTGYLSRPGEISWDRKPGTSYLSAYCVGYIGTSMHCYTDPVNFEANKTYYFEVQYAGGIFTYNRIHLERIE